MWWSFVDFSSFKLIMSNSYILIKIIMIFVDILDFESFFNKMIILKRKRDCEKTTVFEIWFVDFILSSRTNFNIMLKMFLCRCCSNAHLLCYKLFFNIIIINYLWWLKSLNITLRNINKLYKNLMIYKRSTCYDSIREEQTRPVRWLV